MTSFMTPGSPSLATPTDPARSRGIRPRLYLGKLSPPPRPQDAIDRPRLIGKIIESEKPVTLLMAAAGFGKTMLMSQAHDTLKARSHPVAWLSLDHRDNDFSRFIIYLRSALLKFCLQPETPDPNGGTTQENAFSDLRAESYKLIDSLASTSSQFTIFLDDFESIHSVDVIAFTNELIRSLNYGQRLVIGSRSMRTLPLASLEVSGLIHRISTDDLTFDLTEASLFFHNQGHLDLSDNDILLLQQKTEGWVAALRLVTLALPSFEDTGAWIEGLSGRTERIAEYLAENVLARLPENLCRFMLETSILQHLSGNLCDAVLRIEGSHKILEEICRANLFLMPVDLQTNSYEFHSLFRSFLVTVLHRTQPDVIPALHRRAAVFLCSSARYADALDHAILSQDTTLAVDILDLSALRFVEIGQLETVAKWIDVMDSALIDERANIQRARAYALIALHRYPEAQDALEKLRRIAMKQGSELDAEATMQLALMYEWMDRHDLSEPVVVRMAQRVSPLNHMAYSISRNMMAFLRMLKLDFVEAQQALDDAKPTKEKIGFGNWSSTYTTCFEGALEMTLGNSRGAIQRFEAALSDASSAGKSIPSAFLADAIYGKGDVVRAGSLAEDYLRLNRQTAPPDIVILSYRTAARVSFLNGNLDHAELLLTELGDIGDMRDLPRLKAAAWLEKSRLSLLCGDTESATRYFTLGINPKIWVMHKEFHYYPHEIDDALIGKMRMDLVLGDAESAAFRIESAIKDAGSTGRRWRRIRLQCLLAQAYSRMRKRKQATDTLEIALVAAEKHGLIYIFADEPWCLLDLLEEIAQRASPSHKAYIDRVVSATAQVSQRIGELVVSKKQSEILTLKETAIIKLVADGKSNKEIARILSITENTVETHLRRISQKLETKNRTQAVTKAREQGLLR